MRMPVGANEKLDIKDLLRAHDEEEGLRLSDDDLLDGVKDADCGALGGAPDVIIDNR